MDYGIGILGATHYLPEKIQTNKELCEVMSDVTPDWILTKTGIKRRYIATKDDSSSSMASVAAKNRSPEGAKAIAEANRVAGKKRKEANKKLRGKV